MPRVFCPECLRGSNFKATDEYARCQGCRTNLYDHFIRDKDKSETDSLILEADNRRKGRDKAERLKKLEEEAAQQRYRKEIARKESRLRTIKDSIMVIVVSVCIWGGIWFVRHPVSDYFSEESRIIREQEKAEKFETKKREFESRLARNYAEVEYLDLREFAREHVRETEIQNDATEKRMLTKYYRMTGEVYDITERNGSYGYRSFSIQLFEPYIIVTAQCYAKSEADINKITSARVGQKISISGKVKVYGDIAGLQLSYCSVL